MHADKCRDEAEFGGEIPVAYRVHGVRRGRLEAQLGGEPLGIERQRRSGKGAGPERTDCGTPVPVPQPAYVPDQRLDVREQLMAEQHRLRVLQVRHARRGQVTARDRLVD